MKIDFRKTMVSGDSIIDPGTYMVGFQRDQNLVSLSGKGKTVYLVAIPRPARRKVRVGEISFQPGLGGGSWTLLIRMPPQNEWILVLMPVRFKSDE
jgi:hypothetical protein